jgi:hypothetical protein
LRVRCFLYAAVGKSVATPHCLESVHQLCD